MTTRRRDTGTGSVYRRASDGKWVATLELGWIGGKRKRKTLVARTKTDVVAKLKAARGQLDTTGTVAPKAPTLAEWLHRWLADVAAPRVAPRTLQSHRTYVTRHLVPHLGHHRLDKLTPDHVLQLHRTLRRRPKHRGGGTLEEATVLRAHAVLSRALTDAMRLGYVQRNVAAMLDRPGRGAPDVTFLDREQARTLLQHAADDPYGSRWVFALLTGQRQGEALGLRWSHVVDDGGQWAEADVSWQLQRLGYRHGCDDCGRRFAGDCPARELDVPPGYEHRRLDGALCLTRPKNRKRKVVPIHPTLTASLRRHRDGSPPGGHDLVWTRDGTRPVDPRADYGAWVSLLDECGLPRVRLHSARHTCASLLLDLGVGEHTIMQLVGHSTVAAARAYQHLDREAGRRAAAQLGQALGLEP